MMCCHTGHIYVVFESQTPHLATASVKSPEAYVLVYCCSRFITQLTCGIRDTMADAGEFGMGPEGPSADG